jgi:hypothetical protein
MLDKTKGNPASKVMREIFDSPRRRFV